MVSQRRSWIFRSRFAVNVSDRPQCRLGRWSSIKQPGNLPVERQCVERCQLRKNVMRMLMINQWLPMISLARLEQLRETRVWRSQRLGREHLPQQQRPASQAMLFHEHEVIHRLGLTLATWPSLLVVVNKNYAVRHEVPFSARSHPHGLGHRCWLPTGAG